MKDEEAQLVLDKKQSRKYDFENEQEIETLGQINDFEVTWSTSRKRRQANLVLDSTEDWTTWLEVTVPITREDKERQDRKRVQKGKEPRLASYSMYLRLKTAFESGWAVEGRGPHLANLMYSLGDILESQAASLKEQSLKLIRAEMTDRQAHHQENCDSRICGGNFTCSNCQRLVGWCMGMDESPEDPDGSLCDDCFSHRCQ